MQEDLEKQHSWLRHRQIQRPWGWTEQSAVKDQEVQVAALEQVTGG